MKKILVILGPTATGKTDVALFLADKFNGELVACDSRQVYVGLDVGTGKLPSGRWKVDDGRLKKGKGYWEIDGGKVWMYDVVNIDRQYTVGDYVKDASKVIDEIVVRGRLPIIVGGTGLYLRALLEGLDNLQKPVDPDLRGKLGKLTLPQLQKKLQELSPKRWQNLNNSDRNNPRRLLRSIELLSMNPYIGTQKHYQGLVKKFDVIKIGLTAPRQELYKKVDSRILKRLSEGMLGEAEDLFKKDLTIEKMKSLGLEYGVLADFLVGEIKTQTELTSILKGKIHGYVRRQLTWFKKEKDVLWFDITDKNMSLKIAKTVHKWYDTP